MSEIEHETVFLLLGSNLGNRLENLHLAIGCIGDVAGKIDDTSSVWETAPWGFNSPDRFYNVVVKIRTTLEPLPLLEELHAIEKKLGRRRTFSNSIESGNSNKKKGYNPNYVSRTIDIDILFFGNRTIHSELLQIPHPRLHLRRFALEPLMELIPAFVHPLLGKTLRQLYDECKDKLEVNPIIKGV
jgi:2-amino-4-hydroxy-6-hydroxymethyldihydropteridine diphosphokinase